MRGIKNGIVYGAEPSGCYESQKFHVISFGAFCFTLPFCRQF